MAAGGELIQNQPEGKDVRLHRGLAGDELLRRHVRNGAAARRVGRARRRHGPLARMPGGIEVGVVHGQPARQAEVQDLDQPAFSQHDVGRLQVAMEDAQRVRGGKPIRDLNARRKHQLQIRWAGGAELRDVLIERLPGDVLHDDIGFDSAAGLIRHLADVVDRADVGVVDRGGQPRLTQLRGTHLLSRQGTALEQLQHNRPLQQRVGCQKDDAGAAGPDLADKLVVADDAALHGSIIACGVVRNAHAALGDDALRPEPRKQVRERGRSILVQVEAEPA